MSSVGAKCDDAKKPPKTRTTAVAAAVDAIALKKSRPRVTIGEARGCVNVDRSIARRRRRSMRPHSEFEMRARAGAFDSAAARISALCARIEMDGARERFLLFSYCYDSTKKRILRRRAHQDAQASKRKWQATAISSARRRRSNSSRRSAAAVGRRLAIFIGRFGERERTLRTASDERRATSGERRATSGERRAASGERRAASGERRVASGERRVASDERRAISIAKRPARAANGERRLVVTNRVGRIAKNEDAKRAFGSRSTFSTRRAAAQAAIKSARCCCDRRNESSRADAI